ncbi:MAG: glycoside hydrolase family 88 protein [Clostridiales bacterium]|nr:glycoside hydrolase family 88 protein [Clostridiales bacterium]
MDIPDLRQKIGLLVRWQTQTEAGNRTMELFDWPQGVALFALYLHAKEAKDKTLTDYLFRWFDRWIEKGLPGKNVNSMAPMLTLSFLYEDTKKESYLAICKEWLHYIMEEHPRTGEGGFQHKTIDSDNYAQLWDDTLYVAVLFIARMGKLLKRDDCVQESIRQFLVHIKYLHDPVTGLFFHGWTFAQKHHFAGALWGRGNAWYTAGLVDYLELADIPEGVKMFLVSTLRRQIDALKKMQAENGMFHTLLDDPGSYQESSATAGFAYGILKAVRLGLLDESYRETGEKAAAAVAARVLPSGELAEVSAGTCLRMDKDYYRNIPLRPCPYGQSMALLALVEAGKA